MFGNISRAVSGIVAKMQLPGGVLSALAQGLTNEIDQRQAFVSVLLAAAAHVNQKQNFNLELEINDLWNHLTALRSQASSGQAGSIQAMSGLMQQQASAMQQIAEFENGVKKSLESVLRNMR